MTVEDVKKTYQYKLAKKYMKSEFPFIIDFKINQGDLDTYKYVLFLYPVIDVHKIRELYGWKLNWFVNSENFEYDRHQHIAAIFDIPYDEWQKTIKIPSDNIFRMIDDLDLPQEMKIDKTFTLTDAYVDENSLKKLKNSDFTENPYRS